MDPLTLVASLSVVAALLFGAAAVRVRTRGTAAAAELRVHELRGNVSAPAVSPAQVSDIQTRSARRGRFFSGGDESPQRNEMLQRAGLQMQPHEFFAIRLLTGFGAFVIGAAIAGSGARGIALGGILLVVGFFLPKLWISWATERRLGRIEADLPEMLALVANSVRSGFALLQALDSAARRVEGPLAEELGLVLTDIRFGRPLDEALRDLVERTQSRDMQLIVTAILVQRSSGGNLSEVLDNLAQTMRERVELRHQIQALTAYPRLAARIVALYPLAIVSIMALARPEIWMVLVTETFGFILLGIAGVMNLLAFLMMRRMVRIDF